MADIVERVLREAAEKDSKYKTVEVHKDIELDIDEGNLLSVDNNPLNIKLYRSQREEYLKDLARDNTQLLFNRIWELPTERVEDAMVVELPNGKTFLPREKRCPKLKPMTKWQRYVQQKGIRQRKKSRMVWDEEVKEWRPRYGYKRVKDEKRDWVLEVPDHVDPFEDQFAKRSEAKKERVAKNELQRLRNIGRSMKGKVPGVGLTPTEFQSKIDVSRALAHAKKSTASVGKFTNKLPKEKPAKHMGNRRKFESNVGNMDVEKKRALDIVDKMARHGPTLNVEKAVNRQIKSDNAAENRIGGAGKKKGKGKRSNDGSRNKATTRAIKRGKQVQAKNRNKKIERKSNRNNYN